MYVVNGRTVRIAATRLVVAGAATATVCAYCAGFGGPPVRSTAAIVNTATIVSSPTTIGIADSDLYGMSEADIDQTLDTLQSIGVQDVRIFVPWAFVEPTQGTYDWSYLDDVVDAAAARNMGVLAEVSATPAWDAPSGTLAGAGTPNPTDYANFLTQVATRYGNDISSYEIWNEPNYVASYDPIDPATYTALLKAAYPALKAVDPNATVIAGALGSGVSFGNLTLNPVTFVQDMLADGAAGYFDALSFHPYQETLEFSQGTTVPNSPLNQLNAIEQLLAANGLSNDKVWITEYGLPTSDVSQQTQATYIQDLIDTWQTLSYAGPIFIYTAQDGTSTDPTGTYGIYQADWTPKLAVAVIQQEIAKFATAVVTNPITTIAQQVANAVAQALQAVAQQIANAFAQAIANALAQATANAAGTTATAAATPAVKTLTVKTLTATTPTATTPTAATPTAATPTAKSLTATAKATAIPAAPSAADPAADTTATMTTPRLRTPLTTGAADAASAHQPSSESPPAAGPPTGSSTTKSDTSEHPVKPRIPHPRDGHPHDGATSHDSAPSHDGAT